MRAKTIATTENKNKSITRTIQFERTGVDGKKELCVAHSVSSSVSTNPVSYLNGLDQYAQMLTNNSSMSETLCKQSIILSNRLYLYGGICSSALDLLITMANTNMMVVSDSPELNAIMENIQTFVNIMNDRMLPGYKILNEHILSDYNVNGNSFPYIRWEYRKINNKEYFVPSTITPLNPLGIQIQESKNGLSEFIYYQNNYGNGEVSVNEKASGNQLLKKINMKRIARRGKSYFWWGIPYLTKSFEAIYRKSKIIKLDQAITDGIIGLITVFSLSNQKDGTYAKKADVEKFSQLLSAKDSSGPLYIVWPGHVKTDIVGPDGQILKFDERYATVDRDIASSLAIPMFLLNGESKGSNSGSEISIKPLMETLRDSQMNIGQWWVWLAFNIAMQNNIKVTKIEALWSNPNIEDVKGLITVVDNMRDRGLLSNTSANLKMGCSATIEEYLMREEAERKESDPKYVFGTPQDVPFQGQIGGNTKAGGDGRPSTPVEDSKKTVKKIKDAAKASMQDKIFDNNLKEILEESRKILVTSYINKLKSDTLSTDQKMNLGTLTASHMSSTFSTMLDETSNEFYDFILNESLEFSDLCTAMAIENKIDEEIIFDKSKAVLHNVFTEYKKRKALSK